MSAALALLSSLLWGASDFLGGLATRRLPVASVLGAAQLVALLGLAPLALVLGELDAERGYLWPGVVAGTVGAAALAAFYLALSTGTMGVVAPVAALGVVVPVVVGLLQGESPSLLQVAGMAVAVVGVVLASGPELSGGAGLRPLLLAAAAAVGFGVVLVLVAQGSEEGGSVVMVLLTMRLTVVLGLTALLVGLARGRGWELGLRRKDLPLVLAIGLGDVAANGSYAVASQSALVSVTSVLASLYPVVTALLAAQFLRERLTPVQVAGVAASLGGVVLIAAG